MTNVKSYTDLQQSKKLAEILPLESADMLFQLGENKYADSIRVPLTKKHWEQMMHDINPCWSLAALLNVLPNSIYDNTNEFSQLEFTKKSVAYIHRTTGDIKIGTLKDNLIDTCYEMVLKLHELKLL